MSYCNIVVTRPVCLPRGSSLIRSRVELNVVQQIDNRVKGRYAVVISNSWSL